MKFKFRHCPGCLIILFLLPVIWIRLGDSAVPSYPYMKGMTVSCQTWGYEWATPEMKETMQELKSLGINWISIHPYARVSSNGHVRFPADQPNDHITTPLRWGEELEIQVMLKPHLAYWGTKFKWRGDIKFATHLEWKTFFKDYMIWIVSMAEIAENNGAQIFCIGAELTHSIRYEKEWRLIINAVRDVYKGKLTYAANWDSYRQVAFWDSLDFIGIQAYFPLSVIEFPTEKQISEGWDLVYDEINPFADSLNKRIVFTEIGYDISLKAAQEPWSTERSDKEIAAQLQRSCLKVALSKAGEQKRLAGLFLWKWFPETQPFEHHESYNLQRPEIKSLIKTLWF
jgi:hypothetical protein